ncbi:hypothetical protein BO78DRAFT_418331 [Aspergillus sclerotiicarbonarius CBS 121057]|uniref:MFS general substrate transporter n=1 Tax=Aspergillus sclerotiicarbonarius (strain CBS 121057 / IBT 28362) TaxID=1448318 RepID=A0A319EX40_ASPSB|nr:hypothetical protein BO78DRAFT_418331 [Aspergillus sclerotiicarbonarius CBS 121057]
MPCNSLESQEMGDPEKRLIRPPSTLDLMMATVSLAGAQAAFSIQFAYGTNYLSSLGISPSLTSIVWIIPPLCGGLVQPMFGITSDRCRSSSGRRMPFILGGSLGLCLGLVVFAWGVDISQILDKSCGADFSHPDGCGLTSTIVVLSILMINVSVQSLQSGGRALLVDMFPAAQQSRANVWASRMTNGANLIHYGLASLDLAQMFPFLGGTQLKVHCVLACWFLIVASAITHHGIAESPPAPGISSASLFTQLRGASILLRSDILHLQAIQFCTWLAWFPFMLYIRSYLDNFGVLSSTPPTLWKGLGSLALFSQAVIALMVIILLPPLLARFHRVPRDHESQQNNSRFSWKAHRFIWFVAQLLFGASVSGIALTDSRHLILVLTGMTGVSWAVTQWVPVTLLTVKIRDSLADAALDGDGCSNGVTMGLFNLSITVPQLVSMFLASGVFWVAGGTGPSILGSRLVCGLSGLMSAGGAVLTWRLQER